MRQADQSITNCALAASATATAFVPDAATGYNKSSTGWTKNYVAYASVEVYQLTATSLDMRVTVDNAVPLRLLHTWGDSAAGLTMESSLYLGIQQPQDNPVTSIGMNPVTLK